MGTAFNIGGLSQSDNLAWNLAQSPAIDGGNGNLNNDFISIWNTSNTSMGSSTSSQVALPLQSSGTYNFLVLWGDGSNSTITVWNQAQTTHTYASPGTYTITITGVCTGWQFNNGGDLLKILEISQWGSLRLGNSGSYFTGCSNLVVSADDTLDLTGTTNFLSAFSGCSALTALPNCQHWNTSAITTLAGAFSGCTLFNEGAVGFWNTSSVTNMTATFQSCPAFNRTLAWDVSACTSFESMFSGASIYNKSVNAWIPSACLSTNSMFTNATAFNQPMNDFGTHLGLCTVMDSMFASTSFNQDISGWDTASLTSCGFMFANNTAFNSDISGWEFSLVTTAVGMFQNSSAFNAPIGLWDTSLLQFASSMIFNATSFNQNLGNWDVTKLESATNMLLGVTLSTANYNGTLVGWAAQIVLPNIVFNGGNSQYDTTSGGFNGTAARAVLTNAPNTWSISDGGPA